MRLWKTRIHGFGILARYYCVTYLLKNWKQGISTGRRSNKWKTKSNICCLPWKHIKSSVILQASQVYEHFKKYHFDDYIFDLYELLHVQGTRRLMEELDEY
jgi:hypothetical protein